ncbi:MULTISPECIES: VOC family protein [Agathobacter]|uniref:VOC family protein n=1 Tax=Agathobacter rectalis TaxID=39491 RepID=A0A415JXH9_9FIRM|nr:MULTISPECIES: VOC family protein [Agathobacter]RHL28648.1 VOC family protein [Agathobacter rectalis]
MTALDHTAIIISKEENLRFYVRLGFEEIRRIIRTYDTVIFMKNGNVVLEIFVDPNHPDRLTKPESLGIRHIALTVDSLDDVVKKFECEPVKKDWFGRRFTFVKDMDNQPIEINEICLKSEEDIVNGLESN